jgi:hypothetical protein
LSVAKVYSLLFRGKVDFYAQCHFGLNCHFLLLRDVWWSKLQSIFKCGSFFQHQCLLDICGTLRQLLSCIGV